ncbi:MAG TPA: phosphoribosylformylglycinamidine cyclo-ligase [Clostridiaceae bacterium]|jgi:phosphoribosylformylglycinamidine cyclo-ligase|nr:MAG TPA: phosphoribosylaminoimidazole synthetase [Caudoviricetes sp.]HJJ03639.1 phosphoribosylformylglycinamidine cyclo-ligase [Clostridiaceae bacterium]
MEKSFSESYKAAGVDVTAGYKGVELMKKAVQATYTNAVISDIGGFGGLYAPQIKGMEEPILVSGTDGVGTKLKLAFLMDKHDTIGEDCVAMCANDVICTGASPMFFLDYMALGKNIPEKVATIVAGVAEGCKKAKCSLIGGETAEMPGFYPVDEYDLAGFCVGIVDKKKIINNKTIEIGDKVIGLKSSGVHSNGFSLVRKVFEVNKENLNEYVESLGCTVGEALLKPTKIYVKPILKLIEQVKVKGISHITGGGFYENMPRMLREGVALKIDKNSYEVPPIFKLIAERGNIPERDMYNTFNMGIGMAVIVPESEVEKSLEILKQAGEEAYLIGEVIAGNKEIIV